MSSSNIILETGEPILIKLYIHIRPINTSKPVPEIKATICEHELMYRL